MTHTATSTLALAPIIFERPAWLLLLLLIIPSFLLAMRSIGGLSRTKALVTLGLRSLLIVALAMALAHPSWEKRGEGVTATILLDRSQSIPYRNREAAVAFLAEAAELKPEAEDRVAVITIGKDATISAMPDVYSKVSASQEPSDLTATNLADGINLALAIMPDDTANRIILASDGNETEGSVMEAAELARANGVPIDVLLLRYEHENEIIFDRIVAPAGVRKGQTANIKMVLRAQAPARGTLFLKQNGRPIDLNGTDAGEGRPIELAAGPNMIPVMLSLDRPGPQQFEAMFETDGAEGDIPDNNRAVAVTFVGSEGRILVLDEEEAESASLVNALREGRLSVDRTTPEGLLGGLVELSGYDAVVLCNVARWAFDEEQDRMLHAYVHDLGGGLVMLGGPRSFGAGGWIDSETSKVLPVKLDPPSVQQMPRGALVLIMHSCEMAQGNFWGQKVAQSAIEALSRLDYIGIVEFNWGAQNAFRGCSWAFPLQEAGDKSAAITATKQMVVGDMPDFGTSMQLALDGLTTRAARAAQRHVVVISDGDPSPPSDKLIADYQKAKVTITTIMVGGHGTGGDKLNMQAVATRTGGRFYNVTNPKTLPQIFIKEAQLVSRSLIQENDIYTPVVSRLPGPVEGFPSVPSIDGYVLTAQREGLAQIPILIPTSEGKDPLYAYWNYGLGKSVAFTSDARARWATQWVAWNEFQSFWEQTLRWAMRPSAPSNITVDTRIDGDVAVVEVEALGADAAFLNMLQTRGVVVAPDGTPLPLTLQQTGPGRYRGEFKTSEPGAYLVNVNYAGGSRDAPIVGNVQAAVSVPYSREFRSVKHNAALLRQLAERTGGRWLSDVNPQLVDLFDRTDIEVPRTHRRIWDLLAMIAAGIFILDVAARRLAVDKKWIAGLLGRAVSARGETSEDTVAAWKKARSQVKHKRGDEPAVDPGRRFEAGEGDFSIEAGREVATDTRAGVGKVKRAAEPTEAEPLEDEGGHTSRLLRAKRRARGDEEGDDAKDDHGDG